MDRARATYAELEAQSREGKASSDELALLAILVGHEVAGARDPRRSVPAKGPAC